MNEVHVSILNAGESLQEHNRMAFALATLREAFDGNPRMVLELREFHRSGVRTVTLWWGNRPTDGGPILWGKEVARWLACDQGAWVAGISTLMAELRRLRRQHGRKRWEDVVDG